VAVVGLACWAAAVGAFYPEAGIAWRASQAEIAGSWPWALILVFFAPLAEERFFRGLLFARLASHGRPIFALFGSAAAFAAAHSVPGPAVVAAGGGLILGGLRLWSGDWRTPAIAHVAFNALVFSVGFSVGGG
jgi:membrane protease YdiL (CAAX protease family)